MSKLVGKKITMTFIESDGWVLPSIRIHGEDEGMTQGRTDAEALEMAADWIATMLDIPSPWYDRWYATVKRWLNLP